MSAFSFLTMGELEKKERKPGEGMGDEKEWWPEDEYDLVEQVILRYQWLIYKKVGKYLRRQEDREDALQETAIRLLRNVSSLARVKDNHRMLSTYVANTAESAAVDLIRRERRERGGRSAEEVEMEDLDVLSLGALSPDEQLIRVEEQAEIKEIFDQLSEEEQCLAECKWFLGLSDRETAEILQCRAESIRGRVFRLRKKFQAVWKERGGDGS